MEARHAGTGSHRLVTGALVARNPRSRLVRRAALAVVGLATLAFAAPASATTETFDFTGAAQTWTVPAGVTRRPSTSSGRRVADSLSPHSPRTRRPSDGDDRRHPRRLDRGQRRRAGGFPDARLQRRRQRGAGGGGGGASDIRIGGTDLFDRVLVAGGGGGAGGFAVVACRCRAVMAAGRTARPDSPALPACLPVPWPAAAARRPTGAARPRRRREGDFGVGGDGGPSAAAPAVAAAAAGSAAVAASAPPAVAAAPATDPMAPSSRPGFARATASSPSPTRPRSARARSRRSSPSPASRPSAPTAPT